MQTADEDSDMPTKLLGVEGRQARVSRGSWRCEGIAQHSGRHLGTTKLWPRVGGCGDAHPPCLPEWIPKSLLASATRWFRDRATCFTPSQDDSACSWPCLQPDYSGSKNKHSMVSLGYYSELCQFACSLIFQAQYLHLRSGRFKSLAAVGVS